MTKPFSPMQLHEAIWLTGLVHTHGAVALTPDYLDGLCGCRDGRSRFAELDPRVLEYARYFAANFVRYWPEHDTSKARPGKFYVFRKTPIVFLYGPTPWASYVVTP